MTTLTLTIDGRAVTAHEGETVLDAATRAEIYIPTLCFDERLDPFGACRVCMVGVAGARGPMAACTTPVRDGMVVHTQDPLALRVARGVVELVLSDHPAEALAREGSRNELRAVAEHFGLQSSRFEGPRDTHAPDTRHPYIQAAMDECIACGRCVRACDELQGTFALTYTGRGFSTRIAPGVGGAFTDSACVSCGACVSTCPTGALDERPYLHSESVDRTVSTTCGYCGVGCRLEVNVRAERIISIDPALDGPSNKGHTCLKGRFAHSFTRSGDRLTRPLVRESITQPFREASWEEAYQFVTRRLTEIHAAHGPDAIAAISSSRCTNEENYALQKLIRTRFGSHNIDNCSRVCHSPSSAGLIRSLGYSGGTNGFDDIEQARCLLVTGANPTEAHPVVGARLKQAVLGGARLIVIDPRKIELARYAEVFLQLRPGTNVMVFNAIAHVIVAEGLADEGFLAARFARVEDYKTFIAQYTPERAEEVSGVRADDIRKAARIFASSGAAGIWYGLGITEQSQGVAGVQTLINLAALTGNIGRPGAGVNPLRGQNNVQGGSDSGALPTSFTMYQPVTDAAVRAKFDAAWGTALPATRGLMIPEMFDAAIRGSLKAMYVFGEDIAQTDPNTGHVHKALRSLELLVMQDIFLAETAQFAHVVLPGSAFLEKTGTFTNAERRIQKVNAAVAPPGDARQDLGILTELAERLGRPLGFTTAAEAMDEMAALTPALKGVSHARLGRAGLQWPVWDAEHPGTGMLYAEGFPTETGRGQMTLVDWQPPGEAADEAFPMVLVTGRALAHYNCGTMTRHTPNLELHPADVAELHPDDAAFLGIGEGDRIEVESRRGKVSTWAHLTDRTAPGNVFLAFHFPDMLTNLLTSGNADDNTRCPEYKISAVRVRRISPADSHTPVWTPGIHPGA